jgi:Putative zinc-finger
MNCKQAIDLITESLAAPLAAPAAAELAAHVATCDACRAEAAEQRRTWDQLARLPEELPSDQARQRFAAMLAPHLERHPASAPGGRRQGLLTRLLAPLAPLEEWLAWRLPRSPLAQLATAAAAVAIGIWIGAAAARPAGHAVNTANAANAANIGNAAGTAPGSEIGALRQEVHSLSQLVTLSLLKQDSASERLRGVSFGRQAGGDDQRVLEALLDTLARDRDVNVRLAAVDALAPTVGRPMVRDQLLREVGTQSSPMVQIALIDVLLAHDRQGSRPRLLELAAAPGLDPLVRDYLRSRLHPIT